MLSYFSISGREEKAAAKCEFSPKAEGEHREAGSRKISVRKFICDRVPPLGTFTKLLKSKNSSSDEFFVVDPAGFPPALLLVNGRMLLHTLQARIHIGHHKTKTTLVQELFLLTSSGVRKCTNSYHCYNNTPRF